MTVYLLNYKKKLYCLYGVHLKCLLVALSSETLKLVSCGYLARNTMNTHGLDTITLIRMYNLALFLMHRAPVLWIITTIIILLDYHVRSSSQRVLLLFKH